MGWSSGTFSRFEGSSGCATKEAGGIGITAALEDQRFNEFATGINTCITKDGQNAATANIPMGGFKLTNIGVATATTDAARASQVQDGTLSHGTTGGSANAQTLTTTPSFSPQTGTVVTFKAGFTNTASASFKVNGEGGTQNLAVLKGNGMTTSLHGGELVASTFYRAIRTDSSTWLLINPSPPIINWTPTYGGSGSMTYTSVTTNFAYYIPSNSGINFHISSNGTLGGTASNTITISFPFTPVSGFGAQAQFACFCSTGSAWVAARALMSGGPNEIQVFKGDATNWTAAPTSGVRVIVSGWIQAG